MKAVRPLFCSAVAAASIGLSNPVLSAEDDNGFSQEILPMHVVGGVGWTIGLLRETLPEGVRLQPYPRPRGVKGVISNAPA